MNKSIILYQEIDKLKEEIEVQAKQINNFAAQNKVDIFISFIVGLCTGIVTELLLTYIL